MARQTDSREKLVTIASDLIWRRSYYGTSVDLICETCGIKKGSFYHHFESKEALMLVALDNQWAHFKAHLDRSFSASLSPLDRFKTYARGAFESQEACFKATGNVLGCPLYSLGTEIGTQEPLLRARIEQHLSTLTRYFVTAVRDGLADGSIRACDPEAKAQQLLSFSEGAMTLGRIRNDLAPIRAMEEGILRLLT